jgi:methionyl-tRNA synthetase
MTKKTKFYVTTAIDYVNAKPHIGHAFEKVLADVLARWNRLIGKNVFFLTGTDENAQKNAQVAKEKGMPVKEFVTKNSQSFEDLYIKLNISYNDFIRTTEKRHTKIAQEIFKKVYDSGEIYKGVYEGLYCEGCEAFVTEKDLVDGKCPEHNKEPKLLSEESYFFKLSKYQKQIEKFLETYIIPSSKKNEILSRLKSEDLRDLCVARKNLDWGIDNPIDKKFKIYVWFDALLNYYTGAGKNHEYWPADLHIIGKGINWFHSVIWPGILMSAGLPLPKKLLVHGYLTINNQKMSKSLGNVIDPAELADKYSADTIRYSLMRCSVFEDSDYSEQILIERHNNELANKLGNLISRVTALAEINGIQKTPNKLIKQLKIQQIKKHFENYEIDKVLNEIFAFIDICNEYIQNKKPWETKDRKVLYELMDSIKAVTILLWPFMPKTSEIVAEHLKFKITFDALQKQFKSLKISKMPILFKKIETPIENNNLPNDNLKINQNNKNTNNKSQTNEKSKQQINKQSNIKEIMTGIANVNFEDWSKLDLRVAQIKEVEEIEGADKLYKLTLDVGSEIGKRTICAGIKEFYKDKNKLLNKKIIYFSNLLPRKLKGIESQGMLLAASNAEHTKVILLAPEGDIENGARVG